MLLCLRQCLCLCVSNAFVSKTVPLLIVSNAFVSKTASFLEVFAGDSLVLVHLGGQICGHKQYIHGGFTSAAREKDPHFPDHSCDSPAPAGRSTPTNRRTRVLLFVCFSQLLDQLFGYLFGRLYLEVPGQLAVGETSAILLQPPLPSVGFSIGMERGGVSQMT